MHVLSIALLGIPVISLDNKPVATDRHKAIGLLSYLAAQPTHHRRETLAALFWADYPRKSAYAYLRRTLWELNQVLGKGWLGTDRENVWLEQLPGLQVDVVAFERVISADAQDIDALTKATNLYRGDFLQGLVIADTAAFEEWQLTQEEYYRREYAHLLERLVEALEGTEDYAQGLVYAQHWLALDRLNETAWRAVMRQYAGMGERSSAIKAYQDCESTLQQELGVPPQEGTQQLCEAILKSLVHSKPAAERAANQVRLPAASTPLPGSLPAPTTPFIGRQAELEEVCQHIMDPTLRLLTLTGTGGTGKTRLSIQAAARLEGSFSDGIWFIPLAAVRTPQGLVATIATMLGFSFYQGDESFNQQLMDYLRRKNMLIILDNFEQLVSTCQPIVVEILQSAPQVKLLVTSRERINLQAEKIYPVGGLRTPALPENSQLIYQTEFMGAYEAIQLFYERAQRVRPGFQLNSENLINVGRICQLVEGSPLGIELAAAWLEVTSAAEIAREIEHNLDFLESNAGDLPDRQRSLRAVFETSWRMLEPSEQQAFMRLCVFRGSFTRQAAEEVCGCNLHTLLRLVHKSWLQQGEDGRYLLHEVLSQYGKQRLQADQTEWRGTKNRHAEFFAEFLKNHGEALQTSNQLQALEALKLEMDSNIPEAWEWLVAQQRIGMIVDQMLLGMFHYSMIRGNTEDFKPLLKSACLVLPQTNKQEDLIQRIILETAEIYFSFDQGEDSSNPKTRLKNLLEKVREQGLAEKLGVWYSVLVSIYGFDVNFEQGSLLYMRIMQDIDSSQNSWEVGYGYLNASQFCGPENRGLQKKYLEKALAAFKSLGVLHELGITLMNLGMLAASEMNYQQAIDYTLAAQGYLESVENHWGVDRTWMNLADFYIYSGKIEQGLHAFEVTRNFNEKSGNRKALGIDLSWESMAMSRYGSLEEALKLRCRSLEVAREVGNLHDISWHSWELGEIYRLRQDVEQAKRHYDEARQPFEQLKEMLGMAFYQRGYGDLALMRQDWSEAKIRFSKALEYQEQELLSFRVWGLIYFHTKLSTALVKQGEIDEAAQHLKRALKLVNSWPYPDMKALILAGVAEYLVERGETTQAIEVATCILNQPTTWNEVKSQASLIIERCAGKLPKDEALIAQQKGQSVQPDELLNHYQTEGMLR